VAVIVGVLLAVAVKVGVIVEADAVKDTVYWVFAP
jgi:hypothetical protein